MKQERWAPTRSCGPTRRSSGPGLARNPGRGGSTGTDSIIAAKLGAAGGNSEALPEHWEIRYDALGLTFKIRPTSFKHTGLFPSRPSTGTGSTRRCGRPAGRSPSSTFSGTPGGDLRRRRRWSVGLPCGCSEAW